MTATPASRSPTIGIIGGMGPAATADFYARLTAATPASCDQEHLHVVIDSDPTVPDRTAALLGCGPDPTEALVRIARRLVDAGAELLVMPCNSANVFAPRVAREIERPLVNWHEAVVRELHRQRPGVRTIGILAARGTIAAGLYDFELSRVGLTCDAPTGRLQRRIDELIAARKAGSEVTALEEAARQCVDDVLAQGADLALLACTELSSLRIDDRPDVADASELVAEYLVRNCLGLRAEASGCPNRQPSTEPPAIDRSIAIWNTMIDRSA